MLLLSWLRAVFSWLCRACTSSLRQVRACKSTTLFRVLRVVVFLVITVSVVVLIHFGLDPALVIAVVSACGAAATQLVSRPSDGSAPAT